MEKQYKKYLTILITTQILIFMVVAAFIVFISGNIASHNSGILEAVTMKNTEEYMREIVGNTIIRIDEKRKNTALEVEKMINVTAELLKNPSEHTDDANFQNVINLLNQTEYGEAIKIILKEQSGKISLYSSGEVTEVSAEFYNDQVLNIDDNALIYSEVNVKIGKVILFAMQKDIDSIVKKSAYSEIHNSVYGENEYIWVNEVVNYEGGDNYAIRVIHPNLKDTEGEYLSTNTRDIKGNLPYLKELEEIKENGEIVHSYYFKNQLDDQITKKVSYAKLYEPFNWIVATGQPIQDIFIYTNELKEYDREVVNTTMIVCLNIMSVIFLIGIVIIVKTHTKYQKKIDTYVKTETELDALTGAFSRKAAQEVLLQEYKKGATSNDVFPLLMMIDVDNFKKVNDSYGHDVGDLVLKKIAKTIMANIRYNDLLFRWGGEEFIILCRQTDMSNHYQIGEKILRCVNEMVFESQGQCFKVTISIGSSYLQTEDEGYKAALRRADEALYHSKNTGKNKYSYYLDIKKGL